MATATTAPTGILSNIDLKDFDLNDLVKFLTKVGKRTPILSNLVTTQMGDATLDNYTPEQIAAMINIPGVTTGDTIDPAEVDRKREERQKALEEAKRNRAAGRYSEEVKKAAERGEYGEISKMIDTPSGKVFAPSQEDIERMRKEMEEYLKGTGTPLPSPEKFTGNVTTIPNIDELTSKPLITPIPENINMDIYTPIPEQKSFDDYILTMSRETNFKEDAKKFIEENYETMSDKDMYETMLKDSEKYFNKVPLSSRGVTDYRTVSMGLKRDQTNISDLRYGATRNYKSTVEEFNNITKDLDFSKLSPTQKYDYFKTAYENATGKEAFASGNKKKPFRSILNKYNQQNPDNRILTKSEIPTINYDNSFLEDYRENYQDILDKEAGVGDSAREIVSVSPSFRFLNFIKRTRPDLENMSPDVFFKEYNPYDLDKEGSALYNDFQAFKETDTLRMKLANELKPLLNKLFPNKKNSETLQIAHEFESIGLKRGYVDKSREGTGGDPLTMYIDFGKYNSGMQGGVSEKEWKGLEDKARESIKQYLETGEEKYFTQASKYSRDMADIGVQGEAYGFILGDRKPISAKISELMTKAMDRGINLTQEDFDSAERAMELIEKTGKVYAKGGMVGIATIDDITGPLGKF
jgi:hypothetical protein